MKRPLHSFKKANTWNKLVRRFYNISRKITNMKAKGENSPQELNFLLKKLQKIYLKLNKLQASIGVKIAGSALALLLASASLNAQTFSAGANLQADGVDITAGMNCIPVFADIDGDDDLDLYIGEYNGYIKVFTNDGNGIFNAAANLQADATDINVGVNSAPEFADIDGDGDLDLYVGNGLGYIKVFTNNGNGVFAAAANLQANAADIDVGYRASPVFEDIDGDGDMDLYVGSSNGTIKVFTNDGNGIFSAGTNLQADGADIQVATGNISPTFADIDWDGDLDLYIGEYYGLIKTFTNNGNGTFSVAANLQADGTDIDVGWYSAPVFADIDGDGDLDLYVANEAGTINFFQNNDTTDPVITSIHNDLSVDATANCDAILPDYTTSVTATDNCNTNLDITQSPVAGIIISGVSNTITLTVTDVEGNYSDVSFNVEVVDNIVPEITSTHNDLSVDATTNCYAILPNYTTSVTATDNCDTNFEITQSPVGGTTISGVTNIVTLTVTDDAGNSSNVSFNVEVADNILPAITSTHSNQSIETATSCDAILPDYTIFVTATDNCDANLDITQTPVAGTVTSGVINTVVLTATDDAGNSSYVSFNVEVVDNTIPTITCVGNQTINLTQGQTDYTVSGIEFDPTATNDNCSVASIENDLNNTATLEGEVLNTGTTTVTWTITDGAGNSEVCSFDILINEFVNVNNLAENAIDIYPNPTNGMITINNIQGYNLQILDVTGKKIKTYINVDTDKLDVDLSAQTSGVYFIKIYNNIGVRTSKIIVE